MTALNQPLTREFGGRNSDSRRTVYKAKNYAEAVKSFDVLAQNYPAAINPQIQLKRLVNIR